MKTHCLQRKVLGIRDKDGVFAEYTTLPIANLHMVPDEIRDEEAVFTEPLAAALNILQMVDIRKQDRVVVIGDGKLGQLIVRAISTTSCDLTLIGKQKEKLALAEEFSQTRLFDKNADLQNHFDIAVDCTGNKAALLYAGAIVRPRGTIVLKSTYAGNIECNPSLWVVKELKLLGSRCGAFAPALHFMQKEKIDLTKLIEKTFFIADWKEAFETAFTKGALKVLLKI
jgi:threonine dehydrogenase-like Zn-dependent dehydrogenase